MEKYIIIVAGGTGNRMGANVPKQFLPLNGEPILACTLRAFANWGNIILVLPETQMTYWQSLCKNLRDMPDYRIVAGGEQRFYSVYNALQFFPDGALVAVNDGVRPLMSHTCINRVFTLAEEMGSALPVINCVDSLRHISNGSSLSVNRNEYVCVQTPQVFNSTNLKKAYQQPYKECFTDDASVYESASYKINLCDGNIENIKITTPVDLIHAEAILKNGFDKV